MPWSSTDPTKERIKFVLEWEKRWNAGEGRMNLSELCREFGRQPGTAYIWLRRYRDAGHDVEVLQERSHRPHTMPNQVPDELVGVIVAARKYRSKWGPRKTPQAAGGAGDSTVRSGDSAQRRLVRRLQGLVQDARQPALLPADAARRLRSLPASL